jgi:hypothetical protein
MTLFGIFTLIAGVAVAFYAAHAVIESTRGMLR